jgi:hypothetical protein
MVNNMIKSTVAIFMLFFIASASGAELILREGEILDLGNVKLEAGGFNFDKIKMNDKSLILIPRTLKKINLSIGELDVSGVGYIFVYNDESYVVPVVPSFSSPAYTCSVGQNGMSLPPPKTPEAFDLNIVVGFSKVEKLIVLNEGIDGYIGSAGGRGQDGGDSGGADRCVVDKCNGGRGGQGGKGGSGGNGGHGGNVVLRYSGIESDFIHSIVGDKPHFWSFINDLVGIDIKEKNVGETTKKGKGLGILKSNIGAAIAIGERWGTPQEKLSGTLPSGVNILISGGDPGTGGIDGLPGVGGAGYKCTIGKNQSRGETPQLTFGSGSTGEPGVVGKLVATKLD